MKEEIDRLFSSLQTYFCLDSKLDTKATLEKVCEQSCQLLLFTFVVFQQELIHLCLVK